MVSKSYLIFLLFKKKSKYNFHLGTELEFLIFDKKYSPIFWMRMLASIETPFKRGSNLLELIKVAHTFRSLIEETLVNIRLLHKSTKNEDDDGDDDRD